jgi:hypothetical protein
VNGDICAQCCGTEREVTVSCPLDCEYLLEARLHEKFGTIDPKLIPNMDIRVTEKFLEEHDRLLQVVGQFVLGAAFEANAVDNDIREALDAMVKTYRTKDSGLLYETRPSNLVAAAIQKRITEAIQQLDEALTKQRGVSTLRDMDVLGVLVFLQRVAFHWDNKRPRGRSLLSYLLAQYGQMPAPPEQPETTPSLIVP